jgi:hypothetical protein
MQTREKILERIQRLPEDLLPEVDSFLEKVEQHSEMNAFAKLREIKISAAPDFSTKAEIYRSVEKDGE